MFLKSVLFWKILSIGIAVPATFVSLITLITQLTAKGAYQANIKAWFGTYVLALLGWAIYFGVR